MDTAKHFKWNLVLLSIGYIALGVLLLILPTGQAEQWLCYLLGGFVVLLGLLRIAFYFTKQSDDRILNSDLAVGIVLTAVGIFLFTNPPSLWTLLPIIVGFVVLFDSVVKLQNSLAMRQAGFAPWWGFSLASVVTAVLGILLILGVFKDTALIYYLGAVLIADGIINIAVVLTLQLVISKLKHTAKKAIKEKKPGGPDAAATLVNEKIVGEEPKAKTPETAAPPAGKPL